MFSGEDQDPAQRPTGPVPVERVSSASGRDRWLIGAGVAVLIALGAFWVGRQSATPMPAASPAAAPSATVFAAPDGTALPTPFVRPAVIPSGLEAAARRVIASDRWAVCLVGATIRCQPVSRIVLTHAEAQTARTAWPRLLPASVPPGDIIVAAPRTAIAYALFVSLDLRTAPTILDPAVSSAGVAFLDLGPFLPVGRYVVMIASEPDQPTAALFEAVGLETGP
jgi:hypothetical protein